MVVKLSGSGTPRVLSTRIEMLVCFLRRDMLSHSLDRPGCAMEGCFQSKDAGWELAAQSSLQFGPATVRFLQNRGEIEQLGSGLIVYYDML